MVAEKIRRLKLAVEYIIALYRNVDYITKGKVILTLLTTWYLKIYQDSEWKSLIRTYVDRLLLC